MAVVQLTDQKLQNAAGGVPVGVQWSGLHSSDFGHPTPHLLLKDDNAGDDFLIGNSTKT